VSPDQKRLYVVSNDNGALDLFRLGKGMKSHKGRMALLSYNLEPDGKTSFSKVMVDYSPENGPDGLIVDTEGNLWVAVRDQKRPGIMAYTPNGEEKAYIPTPIPTNVGFGRGDTATFCTLPPRITSIVSKSGNAAITYRPRHSKGNRGVTIIRGSFSLLPRGRYCSHATCR